MKYTTVLAAGLAAVASAQDIGLFPQCALQCIMTAISTGTPCDLTDFACVCENREELTTAATPCVIEECGEDVAQNEVLPATEEFCSQVGGGDEGGDDTTTITDTLTVTSTSTATEEETSTPTGGDDETSTSSPGSIVTPAPTSTNNGTMPPPATTSEPVTGGAAVAGYIGSLGMLALGAIAAL
ncbi:Hemoglobin and hemoglobin-haptoglobin-binding protein-like protein [Madurella fahalii]|uniref:Hemoglobin and hemoglobin-haptoglobin-binding protein-like protein n=1 Tax=Madurella fahalii TaxID=1157608 RepID=A0ABQ0GAN9_9PEZI